MSADETRVALNRRDKPLHESNGFLRWTNYKYLYTSKICRIRDTGTVLGIVVFTPSSRKETSGGQFKTPNIQRCQHNNKTIAVIVKTLAHQTSSSPHCVYGTRTTCWRIPELTLMSHLSIFDLPQHKRYDHCPITLHLYVFTVVHLNN